MLREAHTPEGPEFFDQPDISNCTGSIRESGGDGEIYFAEGWTKQKSEDEGNKGNMVETEEEGIGNENGRIEKRGIKEGEEGKRGKNREGDGQIRGEKLKQEIEEVIQREIKKKKRREEERIRYENG